MNEHDQSRQKEVESGQTEQTDTFTAGEAVLDRAKAVSHRIRERVRRLIEGMRSGPGGDSTQDSSPTTT